MDELRALLRGPGMVLLAVPIGYGVVGILALSIKGALLCWAWIN